MVRTCEYTCFCEPHMHPPKPNRRQYNRRQQPPRTNCQVQFIAALFHQWTTQPEWKPILWVIGRTDGCKSRHECEYTRPLQRAPHRPLAYIFSVHHQETNHIEPVTDTQKDNTTDNGPSPPLPRQHRQQHHSLGPSVIPHLWDGGFAATSLFGTNEFLASDTKNIAYSFQHIAIFIKQRNITGKSIGNFPQLQEFSFPGSSSQQFMKQVGITSQPALMAILSEQ